MTELDRPIKKPGDALIACGIECVDPHDFAFRCIAQFKDEPMPEWEGPVTEEVAEKLSQWSGTSARFWLNMQEARDNWLDMIKLLGTSEIL